MIPSETWQQIDLRRVQEAVQAYPSTVPAKLDGLEKLRLQTVPETLRGRKEAGRAYLTKDELLALVEWKLKHGTFRPSLMKLVSSNSPDAVESSTADAYAACDAHDVPKGMAVLTKLSGIGPATASLILSEYDPSNVPFFADELFRYVHVEADKDGNVRGWDRKIAYKQKEFDTLCERVAQMRARLNGKGPGGNSVTALDLEKTAYVLARSASESTPSTTGEKRKRVQRTTEDDVEQPKEMIEPKRGSERYTAGKKAKTKQ